MTTMVLQVRKTVFLKETVHSEKNRVSMSPLTRAYGAAIVANPFLGDAFVEDLSPGFELGGEIGELLMPEVVAMLPNPVRAYGKAAVVGMFGDPEHGAALIHPSLGKPMRAAIGGGSAIIPSNVKIASPGALIDVPLAHKDDSWSFPELDTLSVTIADAPRADEILVIVAVSDGTRIHARVGTGPV